MSFGYSLSCFKKVCRTLGVLRWPARKVVSLTKLRSSVAAQPSLSGAAGMSHQVGGRGAARARLPCSCMGLTLGSGLGVTTAGRAARSQPRPLLPKPVRLELAGQPLHPARSASLFPAAPTQWTRLTDAPRCLATPFQRQELLVRVDEEIEAVLSDPSRPTGLDFEKLRQMLYKATTGGGYRAVERSGRRRARSATVSEGEEGSEESEGESDGGGEDSRE